VLAAYASVLLSVLALSAGFFVLERLLPAERGQPLGHWLFNAAYTPFILAAVFLIGAAFSPVFALLISHTGGGLLPEIAGEGSGIIRLTLFALLYAFVWDLLQYAMHRLQHASPILWRTHRFHHDETALSAVAQARVHPTSYLLAMLFHMPLIILFGPQVPHLIATFLLFRLWGFVNHANVRLGLGPLTILVAGPQWHRIHHSALDEHRDRNFATFFPVIDWLFGTYHAPRKGEYPPTGLGDRAPPAIFSATTEPFVAWYDMARSRFARPAG
jgi:sterol desaturase/sphingolipid hydroxylase (fatty acid hydroxylase superfamily)